MKNRETWLDVAKGLGIILVVYGHSSIFAQNALLIYIYWFHMPAFFIISGYLFKNPQNLSGLRELIKKRTLQLIIPYLSFFIVITLVKLVLQLRHGDTNLTLFFNELISNVFGGRFASGYYGVFWFITCLFATQIVFSIIRILVKSQLKQLIIIILLYTLAHVEVWLLNNYGLSSSAIKIPWNLDVSLITLVYFSLGFYIKTVLQKIPLKLTSLTILLSATFIILNHIGILNYKLDLKPLYYKDFILDFIIPLIMTISLLGISQLLSNFGFLSKFLAMLGTISLVIMYLHVPFNILLQGKFDYGSFIYILVGIIPSIILTKLVLERFSITKFLFLGTGTIKRKNHIHEQSHPLVS